MVDIKFYSTSMLQSWSGPENPPIPLEIRTLATDHKAWKRIEVDCWHHWEAPWAPQPSTEARKNNEALGLGEVNNEHTATGNPTID